MVWLPGDCKLSNKDIYYTGILKSCLYPKHDVPKRFQFHLGMASGLFFHHAGVGRDDRQPNNSVLALTPCFIHIHAFRVRH